jgi:RNA polymerase sigma factor for flagellar operon FliA
MHRGVTSYTPRTQGEDEAELLRKHGAIVDRLARRLVNRTGMTSARDDLWSAGALGLIEAARKFDPTRGASFETFAAERVRGAMLDELRRLDHLPRRLRAQTNDVAGRKRALATELGREPSSEELAEATGFTLEELGEIETLGEAHVSLDWALGLAGTAGEPDLLARVDASRALAHAIAGLPERLQMVLGLIYQEDLNYAEVAHLLEVSKPRVCQLHAEAIDKLREAMGVQE